MIYRNKETNLVVPKNYTGVIVTRYCYEYIDIIINGQCDAWKTVNDSNIARTIQTWIERYTDHPAIVKDLYAYVLGKHE
jgi:hypothetical protein